MTPVTQALADCFATGHGLLPLADALARLRTAAAPLVGTETIAAEAGLGRILADGVAAPADVPAFDRVAVDGFALAGADLVPGGPTRLSILPGRAAAGHPFAGRLPPGHALKALTGAMLPAGADTAVMWEQVRVEGDRLLVPPGLAMGANCRRAGEDMRAGQRLFGTGQRLSASHLAVLAGAGIRAVPVFARLRVALLSAGDELAEPGEALQPGMIHDSNRPLLRHLLAALPCAVSDLGIVRDDPALIRRTLARAAGSHDVVITSGGAARGEEDHVTRAVAELGSLHLWQVALKPGRPVAFGRIGRAVHIGLPGNPVAATVCFLRLARPLLMALAGGGFAEPLALPVPAGFALTRPAGRTELLRARLVQDAAGRPTALPVAREGSAISTSLTEAQGLVELAPDLLRVAPGQLLPFYTFAALGMP